MASLSADHVGFGGVGVCSLQPNAGEPVKRQPVQTPANPADVAQTVHLTETLCGRLPEAVGRGADSDAKRLCQ
jgi:hypothetical protein